MSLVANGLAIWTHPRCGSTTLHKYFKVPITTENYHTRWEVDEGTTHCCTLRHPLDLLVSWYLLGGSRVGGFRNFLTNWSDDRMERDGRLFYLYRPGDTVLRTTYLAADLSAVLGKKVGLPIRYNATPYKQDWPRYYDESLIEIVENRFPLDLKLWRDQHVGRIPSVTPN